MNMAIHGRFGNGQIICLYCVIDMLPFLDGIRNDFLIVIDKSEELVGILTLEMLAEHLLGHVPKDDFDRIVYLANMLKSEIKKGNDIMDVKTAIERLVSKGVINSPDYWLKVVDVVKYADELLINMAKKI